MRCSGKSAHHSRVVPQKGPPGFVEPDVTVAEPIGAGHPRGQALLSQLLDESGTPRLGYFAQPIGKPRREKLTGPD